MNDTEDNCDLFHYQAQPLSEDEEKRLWERCFASNSESLRAKIREKIILAHLGLARSISRRSGFPKSYSPREKFSVVMEAFVVTANKYDPSRGKPFAAYARRNAKGYLQNETRNINGMGMIGGSDLQKKIAFFYRKPEIRFALNDPKISNYQIAHMVAEKIWPEIQGAHPLSDAGKITRIEELIDYIERYRCHKFAAIASADAPISIDGDGFSLMDTWQDLGLSPEEEVIRAHDCKRGLEVMENELALHLARKRGDPILPGKSALKTRALAKTRYEETLKRQHARVAKWVELLSEHHGQGRLQTDMAEERGVTNAVVSAAEVKARKEAQAVREEVLLYL